LWSSPEEGDVDAEGKKLVDQMAEQQAKIEDMTQKLSDMTEESQDASKKFRAAAEKSAAKAGDSHGS